MSVVGVFNLFRAQPHGPVSEGGRMALGDHLREFRARLLRSVLVLLVMVVLAFVFYGRLFDLLLAPYNDARAMLGHGTVTKPIISGVGGPFMLQLKLCGVAGLVASCPYWLYQIWAFVTPGLYPNERRSTRIFLAFAAPLFLGGVALGYWILPKALHVLLGLTPSSVTNLVDFGEYFSFVVRVMLLFGVAFEIPLFFVMLNIAGVLSGKTIGQYRPWMIVGVFVFAAVATPSTDPFTMTLLALPMVVLFLAAEVVARILDRRRVHHNKLAALSDDEASPL